MISYLQIDGLTKSIQNELLCRRFLITTFVSKINIIVR